MALRAQITGLISTPELRWTPQQKAVLELRINATASTFNESARQWEDVGAPLWVNVSFWDNHAQQYNEFLNKGDRITVEGTLVRENFTKRDGSEGFNLLLRSPKLLGVIPRRGSSASADASRPASGASYAPPSEDPWGAPSDTVEAPF